MADIKQITLPSGTTYFFKDEKARTDIDGLKDAISAGVSFIIAWDGTSVPNTSNIPKGVVVTYNSTPSTGALEAADSMPGAFYLVKSSTSPTSETLDIYDEYVVIKPDSSDNTTWAWEKIGDTKLNLSDVVTDVTLVKGTHNVVGANSTFEITQPTISLEENTGTATGRVQVVTNINTVAASGDNVNAITGYNNTSSDTFLKGVQVTAQPTITLTANTSNSTGRLTYVQAQGTATTTKISGSASGGSADWDSKDSKTVITGYSNPSTDTFLKGVSSTTKKLQTTSITGVSGSTTASRATAAQSQTTATGDGTASTANTDWLKGVSVSNEILVIGAATMDTQTTTQFTFGDVTVPTAASATIVATGSVADSDSNGASIVTSATGGTTAAAITALGTASTTSVIGTDATLSTTPPTITLSSGTNGDVTVATGIGNATVRYMSASASGTAVGANGTGDAITSLGTPTTDEVLGSSSTITVTPTTTYLGATATGANTAWKNRDYTAVLKASETSLTVTKGQ